MFRGTGVVVKGQMPGGGVPAAAPAVQQTGSGVVLNFEAADIREVIRNVLGDILGQSYTIDPSVGGQVTIRTTSGIPREALPATLETLLRSVGATMVKEGDLFKIVPQAAAVRGNVTPQLGSSQRALPAGFSVQIVPLRYVGARDMVRLLEPFAKDAQAIRADELRNLLILAGTERELRHMLETIDMFDIDWMAGMSAGVFTLQNADVKSVMGEFEKLVGTAQQSPLAGILRVIPIERMNALLVVSPNPQYLEQAKQWIERLDRGGGGDGPRLYVYQLQNSRAEKIAPLLQQAFTGRAQQTGPAAPPTLAPGTPAGAIVSPPAFSTTQQQQTQQQQQQTQQAAANAAAAAAAVRAQAPAAGAAAGTGIVRNLQAVADKDMNTIIIVATPVEYQVIESALKKLDVPARQVVIEMTIAEITLTDELQFGVEWLFKGGPPNNQGSGGLVFNPITPTTPTTPPGVRQRAGHREHAGAGVHLPHQEFRVPGRHPGRAAPARHLREHQGHQQPAPRRAGQPEGDDQGRQPHPDLHADGRRRHDVNNAVQTTSQYIDTGRAGAGDAAHQRRRPGHAGRPGGGEHAGRHAAGCATARRPPINTRSVQTYVAVPTGDTMIMGGLILDTDAIDSAGLPVVSRIPFFGGLFGKQSMNRNRTELVLFVTPRVVESEYDIRGAVDDLQRRMERLDSVYPATRPGGPPGVPPAPPEFVAPR